MLTLKDYSQYLPYGIEGKTKHGSIYILGTFNNMLGRGIETRMIDQWIDGQIIPVLYPLPMLTEEIEHNGERFVPIVRLLQITNKGWFDKHKDDRYSEVDCSFEGWYAKAWVKFHATIQISIHAGFIQLVSHCIIEQLHQWHFWTGDQSYFEKGLIIKKEIK